VTSQFLFCSKAGDVESHHLEYHPEQSTPICSFHIGKANHYHSPGQILPGWKSEQLPGGEGSCVELNQLGT